MGPVVGNSCCTALEFQCLHCGGVTRGQQRGGEGRGSQDSYLELATQAYEQRQPEVITKARSQGRVITHQIKELRHQFLARMSDRKHAPQIVVAYQAQLNFYRRVREHVLNIAEAIGGEK